MLALVLAACGDSDPVREADPALDAQLIAAARAGETESVRSLLERGASVAARDSTGATALVAAAYGNYVEAAGVLVDAGADVDAKDETEQSAYLIATSEVGDDVALFDLTLEANADVNAKDSYNGTGLIRAADRGNVAIVPRLLETEIEIDHVNRLGWTALLEAVILGDGDERHTQTVRLLVDAGADVSLADGDGVTPLEHARGRATGRRRRSWKARASAGCDSETGSSSISMTTRVCSPSAVSVAVPVCPEPASSLSSTLPRRRIFVVVATAPGERERRQGDREENGQH